MAAAPPLRADWFDGRSSQAQPVLVSLIAGPRGPSLQLARAGAPGLPLLERAWDQVGWPERFSRRRPPRRITVDLREQGSLEIEDVQGWHEALALAGGRPTLAERMQTRWPVFVAMLLVACLGLWGFFRFATPWTAAQLTVHVPLGWELGLSEAAMRDLDGNLLQASRLPAERQAALRARFDALARHVTPPLRRYRDYAPALQLHFRRGLGANAFALPGGTIVITDGMVDDAARRGLPDEALVGVLAHEIGHVVHRHTTRMVVEQGVVNVGLGMALGDVSWVFSSGATLLTGLAYRRAHEGEADCFALRLMRQARLPTEPMADLLLGIDPAPAGSTPAWATVLSTHPDTRERALQLKRGEAGC